ncbi:MAG TPA: hypothetical protein VK666_27015, partial [Chryseolinea sp.]|nr:hypothetical protein [Chryseolinea sp.]
MNIKKALELIQTGDVATFVSLAETRLLVTKISDAVDQFNPAKHVINDDVKRRDKFIYDDGPADSEGNPTRGQVKEIIKVARLSLSIQKKIVTTAAAFVGTPELDSQPKEGPEANFLKVVNKVWEDNKLDYKSDDIFTRTMSERHCAELWYVRDAEEGYWDGLTITSKFKLGMRVISPSSGDELFPLFDDFGDMIMFIR